MAAWRVASDKEGKKKWKVQRMRQTERNQRSEGMGGAFLSPCCNLGGRRGLPAAKCGQAVQDDESTSVLSI